MQTFLEFLHSGQQGAFPDWSMARDWRTVQAAPPHQKMMLALARAGARGLSRAEIAGLVDLDSDTLNELLNALVRGGELAMFTTTDGRRVYRRLL